MGRHVSAFALVVWLIPTWLCAQSTQFTVTADSAGVYKAPSTGSPVLGHVPRGKVFQVARELGSWVKVSWPGTEDGFAYVHVSTGSIARAVAAERGAGPAADRPAADRPAADRPVAEPSLPAKPTTGSELNASDSQQQLRRITYVPTPVHSFGLGGRLDVSRPALGASARLWTRGPLGVQFEISRDVQASPVAAQRFRSTQVAPSVLYSLGEQVSDYVSFRPYVGAGASVLRQTFRSAPNADPVSDSSLGLQAFGGTELTLSNLPHFALSAELGYGRVRQPYLGDDPGGFGVSFAGHWYVR